MTVSNIAPRSRPHRRFLNNGSRFELIICKLIFETTTTLKMTTTTENEKFYPERNEDAITRESVENWIISRKDTNSIESGPNSLESSFVDIVEASVSAPVAVEVLDVLPHIPLGDEVELCGGIDTYAVRHSTGRDNIFRSQAADFIDIREKGGLKRKRNEDDNPRSASPLGGRFPHPVRSKKYCVPEKLVELAGGEEYDADGALHVKRVGLKGPFPDAKCDKVKGNNAKEGVGVTNNASNELVIACSGGIGESDPVGQRRGIEVPLFDKDAKKFNSSPSPITHAARDSQNITMNCNGATNTVFHDTRPITQSLDRFIKDRIRSKPSIIKHSSLLPSFSCLSSPPPAFLRNRCLNPSHLFRFHHTHRFHKSETDDACDSFFTGVATGAGADCGDSQGSHPGVNTGGDNDFVNGRGSRKGSKTVKRIASPQTPSTDSSTFSTSPALQLASLSSLSTSLASPLSSSSLSSISTALTLRLKAQKSKKNENETKSGSKASSSSPSSSSNFSCLLSSSSLCSSYVTLIGLRNMLGLIGSGEYTISSDNGNHTISPPLHALYRLKKKMIYMIQSMPTSPTRTSLLQELSSLRTISTPSPTIDSWKPFPSAISRLSTTMLSNKEFASSSALSLSEERALRNQEGKRTDISDRKLMLSIRKFKDMERKMLARRVRMSKRSLTIGLSITSSFSVSPTRFALSEARFFPSSCIFMEKGCGTALASHSAGSGRFYFEVKILPPVQREPPGNSLIFDQLDNLISPLPQPDVRVGWCTNILHHNKDPDHLRRNDKMLLHHYHNNRLPLGATHYSFGFSCSEGTFVAGGQGGLPYGHPLKPGDILGCFISFGRRHSTGCASMDRHGNNFPHCHLADTHFGADKREQEHSCDDVDSYTVFSPTRSNFDEKNRNAIHDSWWHNITHRGSSFLPSLNAIDAGLQGWLIDQPKEESWYKSPTRHSEQAQDSALSGRAKSFRARDSCENHSSASARSSSESKIRRPSPSERPGELVYNREAFVQFSINGKFFGPAVAAGGKPYLLHGDYYPAVSVMDGGKCEISFGPFLEYPPPIDGTNEPYVPACFLPNERAPLFSEKAAPDPGSLISRNFYLDDERGVVRFETIGDAIVDLVEANIELRKGEHKEKMGGTCFNPAPSPPSVSMNLPLLKSSSLTSTSASFPSASLPSPSISSTTSSSESSTLSSCSASSPALRPLSISLPSSVASPDAPPLQSVLMDEKISRTSHFVLRGLQSKLFWTPEVHESHQKYLKQKRMTESADKYAFMAAYRHCHDALSLRYDRDSRKAVSTPSSAPISEQTRAEACGEICSVSGGSEKKPWCGFPDFSQNSRHPMGDEIPARSSISPFGKMLLPTNSYISPEYLLLSELWDDETRPIDPRLFFDRQLKAKKKCNQKKPTSAQGTGNKSHVPRAISSPCTVSSQSRPPPPKKSISQNMVIHGTSSLATDDILRFPIQMENSQKELSFDSVPLSDEIMVELQRHSHEILKTHGLSMDEHMGNATIPTDAPHKSTTKSTIHKKSAPVVPSKSDQRGTDACRSDLSGDHSSSVSPLLLEILKRRTDFRFSDTMMKHKIGKTAVEIMEGVGAKMSTRYHRAGLYTCVVKLRQYSSTGQEYDAETAKQLACEFWLQQHAGNFFGI